MSSNPSNVLVDLNAIKAQTHELQVTSLFDKSLAAGDGVEVFDSFNPVRQPRSIFKTSKPKDAPKSISKTDLAKETFTTTFTVLDSLSISREAEVLAANFRATFSLGSASAAFGMAKESSIENKTIYVMWSIFGQSASASMDAVNWPDEIMQEIMSEPDPTLRLRLFSGNFGTHFASNVIGGARLAIRVQVSKKTFMQAQDFSAKVKAAFFASGGVSQQSRKFLENVDAEVQGEIVAGGLLPTNRPFLLPSLADVTTFLDDFRAGTVSITPGPILASLKSYWPFMPKKYKAIADIFAPTAAPIPPPTPFGVPRGTILPWYPAANQAFELDGNLRFNVPEGWALCDGSTPGVPDLTAHWLVGTSDPTSVGQKIGTTSHSHRVTGKTDHGSHIPWIPHSQFQHVGTTSSHIHNVQGETDSVDHVPPSVLVAYIMRL